MNRYSALAVAKFILSRRPMTNLRLQKTLDEKKQIKLEIENSIYRDLYNQSKKAPQIK